MTKNVMLSLKVHKNITGLEYQSYTVKCFSVMMHAHMCKNKGNVLALYAENEQCPYLLHAILISSWVTSWIVNRRWTQQEVRQWGLKELP